MFATEAPQHGRFILRPCFCHYLKQVKKIQCPGVAVANQDHNLTAVIIPLLYDVPFHHPEA